MHVIVVAVAKMIITANIPPLPAAIKTVSISAADMSVLFNPTPPTENAFYMERYTCKYICM